jgi:hypothetical protein
MGPAEIVAALRSGFSNTLQRLLWSLATATLAGLLVTALGGYRACRTPLVLPLCLANGKVLEG